MTPSPHLSQSHTSLAALGHEIATGYGNLPLPQLVQFTLLELTKRGVSFTAYDVTTFLRSFITEKERYLPHYTDPRAEGVQPEVHRQMADYLQSGVYAWTPASPNGRDQAKLYIPQATAPPPTPHTRSARKVKVASVPTAPTPMPVRTPSSAQQLLVPPQAWVVDPDGH